MLEVESPVPLTEGESLAFGISTQHVLHFAIGLAVSSPLLVIGAVVCWIIGVSPWSMIFVGVGFGVMFATVPWKGRALSEICWLSIRYKLRPKIILYDRTYRVRAHRAQKEVHP